MAWVDLGLAILAAVAVTVVAGAPLVLLSGFRGRVALSLIPAAAMVTVACAALASTARLGIFGLALLVGVSVALGAVGALVRWLTVRRAMPHARLGFPPATRALSTAVWATLGVTALVMAIRLLVIFGSPEHISQTYDNVFHLNAVRYILDTGDASPLTLSSIAYAFDGTGSAYPGTWHAFTALVAMLSGVEIPVAVNAVSLVIAAVFWPLGVMVFAHVLFGQRIAVTIAVGMATSLVSGFPVLPLAFGVLYPTFLSIALLPPVFALLVVAVRRSTPVASRVHLAIVAAVLLVSVALAHPSSGIAGAIILLPLVSVAFFVAVRDALRAQRRVASAVMAGAFLGLVAVFLTIFIRARPSRTGSFWEPTQSLPEALFTAATFAPTPTRPDIVIGVLVGLGALALLRQRSQRWLVAAHATVACLWVVSLWLWRGQTRYWLTGTWYSDQYRLESLMPLTAIPLAVAGIVACWEFVRRWSERSSGAVDQRVVARRAVAVGVLGALVYGVASPAMFHRTVNAIESYRFDSQSPLVTPVEQQLLDRLDERVPEDALIMSSPWTGASLAYALSDRRVVIPSINNALTDDERLLATDLRDIARNPEVCDAAERLGVTHVLDFGLKEVHSGRNELQGLERLYGEDGFTVIDSESYARLFTIENCASAAGDR